MIYADDKYAYYEQLKTLLKDNGFTVNPYREIQYGIQFIVFYETLSALLRVYEGKKGLRLDFSQCKEATIPTLVSSLIEGLPKFAPQGPPVSDLFTEDDKTGKDPGIDPLPLIGVDESGKGDYFGALVIAGVYVDDEKSAFLLDLGVKDSKKLSDATIRKLAPLIRSACVHSIIQVGNDSYNLIYHKMPNLNHILAWGHAKVMEGVLKQVSCENALSDQFAHASLVKNALRSRGIRIHLFQRHRAETNIAVAAASILARCAYLDYMDTISKFYGMSFPKGASQAVVDFAIEFAQKHHFDALKSVAKLHFKTTDVVRTALDKP